MKNTRLNSLLMRSIMVTLIALTCLTAVLAVVAAERVAQTERIRGVSARDVSREEPSQKALAASQSNDDMHVSNKWWFINWAYLALDYLHDDCRTEACVKEAIDYVLDYPELGLLEIILNLDYGYGIFDGMDVVEGILMTYDPRDSSLETQVRLNRVFDDCWVDEEDRAFLANVAHMIWVELEQLDLGQSLPFTWSLKNLTFDEVLDYLIGPTYPPDPHYGITHHFHFKHFSLAVDILERMEPFYGLFDDHLEAVPRFVEYAGDNLIHFNYEFDSSEYTGRDMHDGEGDIDLSETWQRRITGCGAPSYTSSLLARSVNLPAVVANPECQSNGQTLHDGHRYAYFPTVDKWVHGDSVVGNLNGAGSLGDVLLWETADIHDAECTDLYDLAFDVNRDAGLALGAAFGITFAKSWITVMRVPNEAGKIHCYNQTGCGQIESNFNQTYFDARYGYLGAYVDTEGNISIDDHKYALLDEVAAYWPMDRDGHRLPVLVERTLSHAHGEFVGESNSRVVYGVKGLAQPFGDQLSVLVDDVPALRRNNEELTISFWIRPYVMKTGGYYSGTIIERTNLEDSSTVYAVEITPDGRIAFTLTTDMGGGPTTFQSAGVLPTGVYSHVVVTFEMNAEASIYVDGILESVIPVFGELPMRKYDLQDDDIYIPLPAETRIGGNGFSGVLDELTIYFRALTANDVIALFSSY